ncbi:anti-sigma regulatory factor [Streptacidiphilus sp. PB12-B1b]|uniref:ATP-binding protein n=1 Tax=Streptacidiphilus sp. PB12-B1b TaxID=2705012 RepID=UPI0015F9CA02|nr:ATP-binding protein [Streptacidiphilus sp. PB12-B1b]
MSLVMAHDVPTSSATMAVPHGPASVSTARRRLRKDLAEHQVPEVVIDDAVLILSELLSNACRHARPLESVLDEFEAAQAQAQAASPSQVGATSQVLGRLRMDADGSYAEGGRVVVGWELHSDGLLTLEVTDGGGPTRPRRGSPSLTARGGRGLGIVGQLASDWGVRDAPGEVTVWAVLPARARHARRGDLGGQP